MVKIELQTFVYYHVYLLRDIKLTGHIANHSRTRKLTFEISKKIKFWHGKNIQSFENNWSVVFILSHWNNDWMPIILCLSNKIERYSNLLRLRASARVCSLTLVAFLGKQLKRNNRQWKLITRVSLRVE